MEDQRKPPASDRSGRKPEDSRWNDTGNGPTDWPLSTASISPRNTSIPASVTMKDGILK